MTEDISVLDAELQAQYSSLDPLAPQSHEDFIQSRKMMAEISKAPVAKGVLKRPIATGSIQGVLYVPEGAPKGDGKRPAVFWVHGGGFCTGVPELFQALHEALVLNLGISVFCPCYRLAPEDPYPAGLDDVAEAWKWFSSQGASEHGLDPRKVMCGGTSAGGALALSLALRNRDQKGPPFASLCLEIPVMSRKVDEGSMVDVKIDKIWPRASAKLSSAFYTPDGTEDPHKYAWGDEHPNFHGLPPTYVGVAEQDVLRDGALTVAMRMLKENKCAGLELHLWKGAFHGSTGFLPTAKISIAAKDAIVYFAERTLGVAVQPKQTASQAETLQ